MKNVVVVAGVHGISGRASAMQWSAVPGAKVYGLSRRTAEVPAGVEEIRVDLLDRNDLQQKLGGLNDVTHIVFGAYIEKPTAKEKSEVNVAITAQPARCGGSGLAFAAAHHLLSGREGIRRGPGPVQDSGARG